MAASAVELSDAGAIEQFLASAYGTSVRIRADSRYVLRHRRDDAGPFAMESAFQSADLSFQVEPLDRIVVARLDDSRMERTCAGHDRRYDAGELYILNPTGRRYAARWLPGSVHNCVIAPEVLARVAAGRGAIRFTGLDPHSPAAAARWWRTRGYLAGLLENPALTGSPLVLASSANLLAAVTLSTFPNTAVTEPTIEDRRDASRTAVRRAVAFIDARPDGDISLADVAGAARVSIRAVQLAFRRHLDTTPMAYLRRVRLAQAHEALRRADAAGTTVTAVAARWGFASQSRFAARYREEYGVTPGQTLREG